MCDDKAGINQKYVPYPFIFLLTVLHTIAPSNSIIVKDFKKVFLTDKFTQREALWILSVIVKHAPGQINGGGIACGLMWTSD